MALSKEQKILNKFKRVLNLDYEISIEHNLSEEQLKHIQNYTHNGTCGANILKYRRPENLQILYEMICESNALGRAQTLEKFVSLYGEEIGTKKYEEANLAKAITLENMIKLYGEEEGNIRWKSYCDKQSVSNTFDYKQEKHGWTKDQFDEFNKSRAVTLDNLVKKYGDEEGSKKFNDYCEKQAYTNTKEYLGDKYEDINKLKKINLENMIRIYGKEEGEKIHAKYLKKISITSKTANATLDYIDTLINRGEREFILYYTNIDLESCAYLYDYINHDHKVCIEFQGDFWHMNPNIYSANDFNPVNKKLAKDIWEHDRIKKEAFLKKYPDYRYIEIWESEAIYKNEINEFYMTRLINDIMEKSNAA